VTLTTHLQAPRSFQNVPGRDVSSDREPEFDVAQYYFDQRQAIAHDAPMLTSLMRAIAADYDLTPAQWAQWYSVALGFRPDLIVELGRSRGNSTALFCQAATRLGATRVVSLCNSRLWDDETLPKLKPLVAAGWLDRLDARTTDILDVDYEALFLDSRRVLLLWDAHGFEIADVVLGRILPLLAERSHLVLMHDISDNRYALVPRSYGGEPLWKGSTWEKGTGPSRTFVNIGWMTSLQDQIIAITDFALRNDLVIGSADHEYAQFFARHPDRGAEMRRTLGDELFSTSAHWAFFSLAGKAPPFHFPAVQRRFRHRCDVRLRDVHPKPRWYARQRRLPRTITTSATKWEYAWVAAWQATESPAADVDQALRLRVAVDDAPIGIGVLNEDRSAFLDSHRVLPAETQQTVYLTVPAASVAGPLVVHTWDVAQGARVQLDDVSLMW
jgi:hypothetical protein